MKAWNRPVSILAVVIGFIFMVSVGAAIAGHDEATPHSGRWIAPESANKLVNPLPNTPENIKKGKKIFATRCAVCHGRSGKGDGPASRSLGKQLPNFTSPEFQSQTDGAIFWKITNGNPPMPSFKGGLKEKERWQVILYLRTLGSKH